MKYPIGIVFFHDCPYGDIKVKRIGCSPAWTERRIDEVEQVIERARTGLFQRKRICPGTPRSPEQVSIILEVFFITLPEIFACNSLKVSLPVEDTARPGNEKKAASAANNRPVRMVN